MRPRRFAASIAVALAVLLASAVAGAEPFHSDQWGYTIELPEGWSQLPDSQVQSVYEFSRRPGVELTYLYEAAFQSEADAPAFSYPYLIVQIIPYERLGLRGQISEADIDAFAGELGNLKMQEAIDEQLSDEALSLFDDTQMGQVLFDREARTYLMPLEMQVAGVGKVRGACLGTFGREAVVQLNFYSVAGEWEQHAGARKTILQSFAFDPDAAYAESALDRILPSAAASDDRAADAAAAPDSADDDGDLLLYGVLGGVLGVLLAVGVAVMVFMGRRR